MNTILENYSKLLKINNIKIIKSNNNTHTSKYQIGVYIKNKNEFMRVQKILFNILVQNPDCKKKTKNLLNCKVPKKSDFYVYGQRSGNYNIFQPETFEKPDYYLIRHGTNERIFSSPKICSKNIYIKIMNKLGRKMSKVKGKMSTKHHNNKSKKKFR